MDRSIMAATVPAEVSGTYKSAVLLAGMGPELAARVLSHLGEDQVEAITQEIARLQHIPTDHIHHVATEFGKDFADADDVIPAGPQLARETLEMAVGPEKAAQILGKLCLETEAPSLAALVDGTPPESL